MNEVIDSKCIEAKHLTEVEEKIKEVASFLKETSTLITVINAQLQLATAVSDADEKREVGYTRLVEVKLQLCDVVQTISRLNIELRVIRDEVE